MPDLIAPAHSGYVACRAGDSFFAMADIAYDANSGRWEQGTLELMGRFRLSDDSTVDHAYPMPAGPAWQTWGAVFVAPDQASGVLFLLRRVADPSDATVYVTNLQLRRQVDDVVIKDGAIQAKHIAAETVLAVHIAAHSITANEIQADTITANEIGDGAITSAKLLDAVITSAKIADLSVETIHIKKGSINNTVFGYQGSFGGGNGAGVTITSNGGNILVMASFAYDCSDTQSVSPGGSVGDVVTASIKCDGVTLDSWVIDTATEYNTLGASAFITVRARGRTTVMLVDDTPQDPGDHVYQLNVTHSGNHMSVSGITTYVQEDLTAQ